MLHNGLKPRAIFPSKPVFNIVIQCIYMGLFDSDIEWKQSMLVAFPEF